MYTKMCKTKQRCTETVQNRTKALTNSAACGIIKAQNN